MGQRPFIVVGDQTDHGGVVVEGSGMTDTHGKRIARVGDQVTCPKKGHGTTVIVSGDATMIIDGKPAARHGDKCACGATLIASQFVSTTSDGGAFNPQAASQAQRDNAAAKGPAPAPRIRIDEATGLFVIAYPSAGEGATDTTSYAVRFQALDPESGEPLPQCDYVLVIEDGTQQRGVTDSGGFTKAIETSHPEEISVHFLFKSPNGTHISLEELAA